MPLWRLYYHIVWATKQREPLLEGDRERSLLELIEAKAVELGATVHALKCVPDHVHVVVSIPPRIAIAEFVRQIKGVSSALYNKAHRNGTLLYWQEQYSVFSFDGKSLGAHVRYVLDQKEHHRQGTTVRALERLPETALDVDQAI